jgi:hypothetical protein
MRRVRNAFVKPPFSIEPMTFGGCVIEIDLFITVEFRRKMPSIPNYSNWERGGSGDGRSSFSPQIQANAQSGKTPPKVA